MSESKNPCVLPADCEQCDDCGVTFKPENGETHCPECVIIAKINAMDHYEMCRLWRFGGPSHYFDSTLPYAEIFKERLFTHFGGFTPQISKSLGW